MKPAPFTYHAPSTVSSAVSLLEELAPQDGRVLAGGQSLIPAMALRMARPAHLIDINGIEELARMTADANHLRIGACVRHAALQEPAVTSSLGRLLQDVAGHIAHAPIRERGTFCGSLANADPASEWCLTAVTLGACLEARSARGSRTIAAAEFFAGVMTTTLAEDELLVGAALPLLSSDTRFAFCEFNRRAGDFAIAMTLVTFQLQDGAVAEPRIGIGGVEVHPRRIFAAEDALRGRAPEPGAFRVAADAIADTVDPMEDATTPAGYRRDLAHALTLRALERAAQ